MRMWGGRFDDEPDARMVDFTRSIEVDAELALDDIAGSIAHVRGLGRAGLLTDDEVATLEGGLAALRRDVEAGAIAWDPTLEDVHLNLETMLTSRVGPSAASSTPAARATTRSRRTCGSGRAAPWTGWTRRSSASSGRSSAWPSATGTPCSRARPTSSRPSRCCWPTTCSRTSRCSSATAAGSPTRARASTSRRWAPGRSPGPGIPLDRAATAAELGFDGVTANSLDAVSDRDFVVELLAAAALAMVHLSRLAEEVTWWSNPRFGFIRVADAFSTGSSMMPNKKNPDPAELVRGRTAAVIGALTTVLALLKGLPLAYQRDLQEDKPALFASVATLGASLGVMAGLVETLAIDRARMRAAAEEGYTTATALADALVRRGVPFRAAHHIVGGLVGGAEAERIPSLAALPDEAYRAALDGSDDPVARALAKEKGIAAALREASSIEGAMAAADVVGGTAPERVRQALDAARERLGA